MPTITLDGQKIEAKPGQMILQAAMDAGIELPHYCYHPGLSIVASCRICLAEVEGVPKLLPTCQTPIRDGMVVNSKSPRSIANQKQVMEYLLINHPLDCPVCDQSGECYLQDYSYQYGRSQSRFEEDKLKKPKKIVGEHVMLYNDRCIMCTRCVRFTREVSGKGELMVSGRGHREEIDIFPGRPLDNNLSVNVVDLCPVGALLDRDFLFKQRVWLLRSARSLSPADAGGENIYLQYNEGVIHRVKPRFNPDVNQWWISNDTRHSYQVVHSDKRLRNAALKVHGLLGAADANDAIRAADEGLKRGAREGGHGSLFALLSPMMACEEAYLLATYIRSIDPEAVLVLGPVPDAGEDEVFHNSLSQAETFRIRGEKVPNRRGIERVMEMFGAPRATWPELVNGSRGDLQRLRGGFVVGGYLSDWVAGGELPASFRGGFLVAADLLVNAAVEAADVVLPAASWAEKAGCWENVDGKIQPFEAAIENLTGTLREGEVLSHLLGRGGLYDVQALRAEMAERDAAFADVEFTTPEHAQHEESPFEFAEL